MTKKRTHQKSFYYQQTHTGANYEVQKFWSPGELLKECDEQLLESVKLFYREHGYSPSKKDISIVMVQKLKVRFRTWKNVLIAAGLPAMNDAETQRQRKNMKAQREEREEETG